jgi:hypothetical protein
MCVEQTNTIKAECRGQFGVVTNSQQKLAAGFMFEVISTAI